MTARKWLFPDADLTAQGEEHNDARGVTIRWRCDGYGVEFMARQGVKQDDGRVSYTWFPAHVSEPTDDFEQAERFVDGWIKWDGCSHFYFGDGADNPGYLHLCGGHDFEALMWVMRRVTDLAVLHAEKLDQDCADFPLDDIGTTLSERHSSSGESDG